MPKLSKPITQALESLTDRDWFVLCDALHIARVHVTDVADQIDAIQRHANYTEALRVKAERFEDIRELLGRALHLT